MSRHADKVNNVHGDEHGDAANPQDDLIIRALGYFGNERNTGFSYHIQRYTMMPNTAATEIAHAGAALLTKLNMPFPLALTLVKVVTPANMTTAIRNLSQLATLVTTHDMPLARSTLSPRS